jgi:hypothetical protein
LFSNGHICGYRASEILCGRVIDEGRELTTPIQEVGKAKPKNSTAADYAVLTACVRIQRVGPLQRGSVENSVQLCIALLVSRCRRCLGIKVYVDKVWPKKYAFL